MKDKKKMKFESRPICSCGVKMKLVEYRGYYEEFRYWDCDNCKLDDEIQNRNVEADKIWKGSYY
ncbi:hypothetical protein [Bacillus sp. FJAT-49736]|uniref:hypothetical protein n=1 Tax=Bacillus sp. FJAT-49736 TaxID=2833582 RepID=UPI001BC9C3B7|nr:hypothetical protein [Bacillus sp. FJAT-49736]MBS4173502.1 hypothetical protein [Bacillus sp. FJAT-49736]